MWLRTYRVRVQSHVTPRILVHGFEGVDLSNTVSALYDGTHGLPGARLTSPPSGQVGAEDQNAPHTEH